ncbi:MAG: MFS transporter [Caldilineaceae bacterium]
MARAAYQMGKTPLLPIFAAGLGASDVLLGLIVSVSTVTGMVLKPFIGMLSDRAGRRNWLIIGTCFFAFMPFVYPFVTTPQQLFWVRVIHGMATAIYGPVTLAYVTEQAGAARAEGLGWFGIARSGGYIVGPALAGWLLLYFTPQQVFTVIGLMSCTVFVPVLMLTDAPMPDRALRKPLTRDAVDAFVAGMQTPALWLAGGLEALTYVALYAMKAFLPVYTLAIGVNVALIGIFCAARRGGGAGQTCRRAHRRSARVWVGHRRGHDLHRPGPAPFDREHRGVRPPGPGRVAGSGAGADLPSATALVAVQIDRHHIAAGMGFLGTLQNSGKVIGPLVGGALVAVAGYEAMFRAMGLFTLLCAGILLTVGGRGRMHGRAD